MTIKGTNINFEGSGEIFTLKGDLLELINDYNFT